MTIVPTDRVEGKLPASKHVSQASPAPVDMKLSAPQLVASAGQTATDTTRSSSSIPALQLVLEPSLDVELEPDAPVCPLPPTVGTSILVMRWK